MITIPRKTESLIPISISQALNDGDTAVFMLKSGGTVILSKEIIQNGDDCIIRGNIAAYGNSEFVWSEVESKWREFGSTGGLKALAFKDSASADYTPAGSVTAPNVTVTANTASVTPFGSAGTLPKCTLPKMTATVSDETLTLGWSAGSFDAGTLLSGGTAVTVATGIKSATASAPKFSGTAAKITVE